MGGCASPLVDRQGLEEAEPLTVVRPLAQHRHTPHRCDIIPHTFIDVLEGVQIRQLWFGYQLRVRNDLSETCKMFNSTLGFIPSMLADQ